MELKTNKCEKEKRFKATNKRNKRCESLTEQYFQKDEIISNIVSFKNPLKMSGNYRKRLLSYLNDKEYLKKNLFYSSLSYDNMMYRRKPHPYSRIPCCTKYKPIYKTLLIQGQPTLELNIDKTKLEASVTKAENIVEDSSTEQKTYRQKSYIQNINEDDLNIPLLEDEDTTFLEDSSNLSVQITDLILTLQHTEILFQSRQILTAIHTQKLVLPTYQPSNVYTDLQCYTVTHTGHFTHQ